jgi:hypothetical protein
MLFWYESERSVHLRTRVVPANEVRIPEPAAGELVVIERYGKPYAAVIDAESLQLFQRLLAMFGERQPVELTLSDTALAVHRASEAGEDVEDFDFDLLATHPAQ